VPLDERVREFPLAARELAAVPLERRLTRARRAQLLPLADKFGDQLMQFLDARPDEVASEAERPVIGGGGVRLLTDRECLSGPAHARAEPSPTSG